MENAWTRFVQSVQDVQKALDYYVDVLGWEDPWKFGTPPDYAGCYGFSEQEFRLVCDERPVEGYPLHVTAEDLPALLKTHRQRGVQVLAEFGPQAWDEIGYVLRDLNGYHVRFTVRRSDQPHTAANLVVPDLDKALAYYQFVLGFSDVEYWADDEGRRYARMEWPTRLEFWENPELAAQLPQHMISIYGDGVDDSYARHVAHGVKLVDDLEAKPWGLKQYVIEDPNGYLLRFGEEHDPEE